MIKPGLGLCYAIAKETRNSVKSLKSIFKHFCKFKSYIFGEYTEVGKANKKAVQ